MNQDNYTGPELWRRGNHSVVKNKSCNSNVLTTLSLNQSGRESPFDFLPRPSICTLSFCHYLLLWRMALMFSETLFHLYMHVSKEPPHDLSWLCSFLQTAPGSVPAADPARSDARRCTVKSKLFMSDDCHNEVSQPNDYPNKKSRMY